MRSHEDTCLKSLVKDNIIKTPVDIQKFIRKHFYNDRFSFYCISKDHYILILKLKGYEWRLRSKARKITKELIDRLPSDIFVEFVQSL